MQVICTDFYGKEHLVDPDALIDRLSAYGICLIGGKVLLVQDPRSLRWELPGGGVEQGETPEQSLTREFIEETGASPVGIIMFIKEWEEYFYDVVEEQAWRSKRMFYLIEDIDNRKKLLEQGNGEDSACTEFISLSKMKTLNIAPNIRKLLTEVATAAKLI